MILVVGSTGFLGSEICRRLTSQGKAVRGLVRATSNPERVTALEAWGAETVLGDLRDPVSLRNACRGVSTVISSATAVFSTQPGDSISTVDHQGQLNLVQAAQAEGVKHFIYISFSKNCDPGPNSSPLTLAKREVEKAVQANGMAYTILRPCFLTEVVFNPMAGFDFPNAKATIYGDGHSRMSYISLGDVAQFASESVSNPAASGQIIELCGPAPLSALEAVRIFERLSGKSYELQFVPTAALNAQRQAATDPLQQSMATIFYWLAQGFEVDNSLAREVFSFPLSSVEDYARKVLTLG